MSSPADLDKPADQEKQVQLSKTDDKLPENSKQSPHATNESQFKEWFSFCLSCNHCMHAGHAEEWFSKHYVCPVPDCECKCNNR